MTTEREVEQYLVRKVKALGGMAYKWASPGQRGVPDRLVVLPGGWVRAVELKRPGGKPTTLQLRAIAFLTETGLPACVLDSKDKVDEFLSEYEDSK